jgi:hypothetical protein
MRWVGGIGAAVLACSSACSPPLTTAPPTAATAVDFTATVTPVFRLVAGPALIDLPSRVLVVRLTLAASSQAAYYAFTPSDLSIVLPDGTRARILDPPRAEELLRRTTIAEADLSYLNQADHVPGGLSDDVRDSFLFMVRGQLLAAGTFGPGQPLEGYLVVDTERPVMTLDGAAVEVVAQRFGDEAPARFATQVAGALPNTGQP